MLRCGDGRGLHCAAQPPVTLLWGCWGAALLRGGFAAGGLEWETHKDLFTFLFFLSCPINALFCVPVEGCVFSLL